MDKKFIPDLFTLTSIFDGLEDSVMSHDLHNRIISWNPAAETIFGYSIEEIIGKSIYSLIPERLQEEHTEILNRIKEGHRIDHLQTYRRTKTGQEFPVSIMISPTRNESGLIMGASHVVRNIANEQLAIEKQGTLSAIIDSSEDAIISKTLTGVITSWNTGAEKLFGYTQEEAIGKFIIFLIPTHRIKEEEFILNSIRNGNRIQHFQTTRLSKSGVEIPISLTVSPVKDNHDNIIGISKIARNITKEKHAAEKQAMLAAIIESSDDGIISKTLDGIITTWNQGAEKILGYKESEIIGQHVSILIPLYRIEEENIILESIKRGEKVDHFQTTRLNKYGEELDISLTVSPIKDLNGDIIGASKIVRDITAQKRAEAAIKQNATRLEILNSIGKAISEKLDIPTILQKVIDATTKITGAAFGAFFYQSEQENGEITKLYKLAGITREGLQKTGLLRDTDDLQPLFFSNKVLRTGNLTEDPAYKINLRDRVTEGEKRMLSYLAVPVVFNSGSITGGLFFGHPAAAVFKKEQEDLVVSLASQAAVALENSRLFDEIKMLSLKKDEFMAMASHELKTPLTSMSGFLQILRKNQPEGTNRVFLERAMIQLQKLNALITDLFDISKIQAGKLQLNLEKFDLVAFTGEIIEAYKAAEYHHVIHFESEGEIIIEADKLRLDQVLNNLITNAIKYSPGSDKIDVKIKNSPSDVSVAIRDYGFGISKENITHIFSQFFRAEGVSKEIGGLGLGLYISKEIIERHQGTLTVESEPGIGSVFTLTLSLPKN